MRALLSLLLLAACSQEPEVQLAGEFDLERVQPPKQICSADGAEALLYRLSDGTELDPIATGRECDYEANQAYLRAHGRYPNAPWRTQSHAEWLAAREARGD